MATTANKRGNNEGSVYFDRSKSRWFASLTLADGRRTKVSGKTRKEAADKLILLQGQVLQGLPAPSADHVGEFLDWWLETLSDKVQMGELDIKTLEQKRMQVDLWMKPHLGSRPLRDLQPEDVERMLRAATKAGRSRATVTRLKTNLAQALNVAMRRGKVARNVAQLAEKPFTPAPTKKPAMTEEQASALLAAAKGDRLEGLWTTGLLLGLRPGELLGLRWEDIDLDAGRLVVNVSMKLGPRGGAMHFDDPKTAGSRRGLSLPSLLVRTLTAHKERQNFERSYAGSLWQENDLVFATTLGTPINPSNLRREFDKVCEKAGIGRWTPNQMRHTAASLLHAQKIPLEEIADLLGHESTRMLERHYKSNVRATVDSHIAAMESMFDPES